MYDDSRQCAVPRMCSIRRMSGSDVLSRSIINACRVYIRNDNLHVWERLQDRFWDDVQLIRNLHLL